MGEVKTAEVSAALAIAKRVVPMGAGSEYRLEVSNRAIRATDGLEAIEVRLSGGIPGMPTGEAPMGEGESVTVSAPDLAKVLKEWKAGEAFSAVVIEGRLRSRGVTLPEVTPEVEVPELPEVGRVRAYPPDRVVRVSKFAAADDMRPILAGVWFGDSAMVATDSFRLAYDQGCRLEEGTDGFTLSAEKVRHVAAAAGETMVLEVGALEDGTLRSVATVNKHESRITAHLRMIEGQFPDYLKILPEDHPITAEVEVRALEGQAAKCARWQTGNVPAVLSVNGRIEVGITGENGTVEPAPVSGPVERGEGAESGEVRIGANPKFLESAAGFFSAETAKFGAIGPLRPMVFRDNDSGVVLMPIRLRD